MWSRVQGTLTPHRRCTGVSSRTFESRTGQHHRPRNPAASFYLRPWWAPPWVPLVLLYLLRLSIGSLGRRNPSTPHRPGPRSSLSVRPPWPELEEALSFANRSQEKTVMNRLVYVSC
jgi:hypothetical protein